MKYDLLLKLSGNVFQGMIKPGIKDKAKLKLIKKEYKDIMTNAKDIGNRNVLIISYAMGAYFIAMVRHSDLDPDTCIKIFHDGIKKSKFTKMSLGNAKAYFSKKKRLKRRKWSSETKQRKYKNDWVVEINETDPNVYEIDYLECGLCKLCKDEGCFELAKYLCSLDFMLADVMGLHLNRTSTIAEGGKMCDFKYTIKK